MPKLHQLFFGKIAVLLVVVFVVGAGLGYVLLRDMVIEIHANILKNMLEVVDTRKSKSTWIVSGDGIDRLGRDSGMRITLVDPDGIVIYDSEKAVSVGDHLARPEIEQALKHGWGRAIRRSEALDMEMLYMARRVDGGVLRFSCALSDMHREFFVLWTKYLLFFSAVLLLVYWLNRRWYHQKVAQDVETVKESLLGLLKKDFSGRRGRIVCCREFDEIEELVEKVSKKLKKQEKQKEKYTRKLKLLTKRQGDIVSAIGNEFKNPVAAIMGYTQTLMDKKSPGGKLDMGFLEKIHSNAEKISHMIDRLSLAIKLDSSSFELKRSEFSLLEVVEEACEVMRRRFPGRKIKMRCEDTLLFADRDMIENVLVNLLENALEYSKGKVLAACDGKRVEVVDEGIGISTEEMKSMGERFYRVGGPEWSNSISAGLFIVKYILQMHDTDLQVESAPNKGSRFFFYLDKMRVKSDS